MHHRLLRHLQTLFKLQPGRPAVWLGIRAAAAVTLPFLVLSSLGLRAAGWAGLTGLLVTLSDRGGSYSGKARVMAWLTGLGGVVGGLAALAGDLLWLDGVLLLSGVLIASFFRCYGPDAGSVGDKLAVIFVASLGAPAVGLEGALERGGAFLVGGGWAMVQSLLLWPLRPYRPARRALAQLYATFRQAAGELAELARAAAPPARWEEGLQRYPLRLQLERARETLVAVRLGQGSEARRFEHLLVLVEHAEPLLTTLGGLALSMEAASADERLAPVREEVAEACERFAQLAGTVVVALGEGEAPHPCAEAFELREGFAARLPPSVLEPVLRLRLHARGASDAAEALVRGRAISRPLPQTSLPTRGARRASLRPLLENLRMDSLVMRHALRAGLIATAALFVASGLGLHQTHWVVLAAIGILQPYSVSTEQLALHRVSGTLLGGTLAAALSAGVSSQLQLFVIIGLLTAISVSLLPLNFGAFQLLLTPDFLLVASLSVGDWSVAADRAVGVMIACALALLGVWLVWPSPERRLFPTAAAALLRADCRYLQAVTHHRSTGAPEAMEARRKVGLRLMDADASLQRLVAEHQGPASRLEPAMAVLTYSRRLAGSVSALGEQLHVPGTAATLRHVADGACGALDALAHTLEQRAQLPPPPSIPLRRSVEDPIFEAVLERIPRQVSVLRGAVEKLTHQGGLGPEPRSAWLGAGRRPLRLEPR